MRADIVFRAAKVAVFVDGCFWHGCPDHWSWPTHNGAWWRDKISTNRSHDEASDALLTRRGWTVLRFWEHEDPESAARAVEAMVRRLRPVGRRERR